MQLDDGKEELIKLSSGPADDSRRSCTDVACFFSFIFAFATVCSIGIYGALHGNILKITQGFDSDHKACGIDIPNYPYIYFVTPNPDNLWKTICVSECPAIIKSQSHHLNVHIQSLTQPIKCSPNSVVNSCSDGVAHYDTVLFDKRVCVPTDDSLYQIVFRGIEMGFLHQLINDIWGAKYPLILFTAVALILTLLFTYLLRWCSSAMIWIIIVLMITISSFLGYFTYQQYRLATTYTIGMAQQGYLVSSICWWTLGIATIILTICFYKRINLAIAIIRCASDFVTNNLEILWCPFTLFFFILFITGLLLSVSSELYSTGTISTAKDLPFEHYKFNVFQHTLCFYLLFVTFWVYSSILSANNFIVSGCVCIWYWKQGLSGQDHIKPLRLVSLRLIKYHLGTVFLGGFLLGVVGLFRWFLEYLYVRHQLIEEKCRVYAQQ